MLKVVIVENEAITRKGIIETIDWASMNCVVIGEASDGQEGINIIKELKPDLVITDIRMPHMDGVTMITKLHKSGCQSKFILLTAHSDFDYARGSIRAGAIDYLLKPLKDSELKNAIKRAFPTDDTIEDKPATPSPIIGLDFNPNEDYSNKYVKSAVDYIKSNYKNDINISDVANYLDISEGYLSRIFKRETNYTFTNYLSYYRINLACALLKNCRTKIYEVANEVGYEDTAYFSTLFKKVVGVSPTEYQLMVNSK